MENSEPEEILDVYRKRSLKCDTFFQTSLVVILIGLLFITIGTPNYYSVPPEPATSPINLYDIGTFILLLGVILLIAALARYVSNRMSDEDFWWVIRTGPFSRPN
jgi:hypothetical protein